MVFVTSCVSIDHKIVQFDVSKINLFNSNTPSLKILFFFIKVSAVR